MHPRFKKNQIAGATMVQHLPDDNQSWLVFFSAASFIIIGLLLWHQVPQNILLNSLQPDKTSDSQQLQVLLENEKTEEEKEKKHMVYLSDQDASARGQLTREKGFEALTRESKLQFAKKGKQQNNKIAPEKNTSDENSYKDNRKDSFSVQVFPESQSSTEGAGGTTEWGRANRTTIPTDYRFRDRFALSWDRNGNPRIPTKNYKHYRFFRDMLDKIKDHWAPPGGQPYPTFGDSYHQQGYVPGSTRVNTFPSQDVKVVFLLNSQGDVLESRIHHSLGYTSLDMSCLEAIDRSRNFGPPPPELLQDGALIVPMIFRIVVR